MGDGGSDSMGVFIIPIAIVFFAIMYIVLGYPLNSIIDVMNGLISDGLISEQTQKYLNTSIDFWKICPFFMIIGLAIFVFERTKGTDISIQTYFSYMFFMMVGILASILFTFMYGITVDSIVYGLSTEQLMNVPSSWDGSGYQNFFIRLLYYACLAPAFIGSILYIFHPIIKQTGFSIFSQSEEEYTTDYNLNQF